MKTSWSWLERIALGCVLVSIVTNLIGLTHSPESPIMFYLIAIYARLTT